MGDPPRTTDRMHRHKHRHEPTNKTQGPSAIASIAHRTKAITRLPTGEKDPAKNRIRGTTIRSCKLHSRSYSIFSLSSICCSLSSRSVGRLDCSCSSCLQAATLPPKDRRKKTHLRFRSYADGLASLEHPSIPVATSGPAQSIPTLLGHRQKDPFFPPRHTVKQQHSTLPETRIHSHTFAWSTTAWPRRPLLGPRLVGNISWCAHRCDVRIDTSSTADGLEGCHLLSMRLSL